MDTAAENRQFDEWAREVCNEYFIPKGFKKAKKNCYYQVVNDKLIWQFSYFHKCGTISTGASIIPLCGAGNIDMGDFRDSGMFHFLPKNDHELHMEFIGMRIVRRNPPTLTLATPDSLVLQHNLNIFDEHVWPIMKEVQDYPSYINYLMMPMCIHDRNGEAILIARYAPEEFFLQYYMEIVQEFNEAKNNPGESLSEFSKRRYKMYQLRMAGNMDDLDRMIAEMEAAGREHFETMLTYHWI